MAVDFQIARFRGSTPARNRAARLIDLNGNPGTMIDCNAAMESEKNKNGLAVKNRTGIIKDPRYAGHCMGPDEPECPERLDVLYALLQEPELEGCFQNISPSMVARGPIGRVHFA